MAKPDKIRVSGSKLPDLCKGMGYKLLPIMDDHVKALETLIYHNLEQAHNDPFDRILIAQAKAEGFRFVTHDSKIPFYEESCVIDV